MTLRSYCEQMGLRLERATDRGRADMRTTVVRIPGWEVIQGDGSVAPIEARGATCADAAAELVRLIGGRILRNTLRPTTLYWVPDLTPR